MVLFQLGFKYNIFVRMGYPCVQVEEVPFWAKVASCAWYSWIYEYLQITGITKTVAGPKFYYLFDYDKFDMLIFVLYVDYLVLTVSLKNSIPWCNKKLESEVDMYYFLVLEVWLS